MNKQLVAGVLASAVMLSGCQEIRNEQVGQLVGGGLGGLLGAQVGSGSGQIAAAVAGGLLGAFLGGNVGRTMDEVDRRRAYDTLERNPTGQTSSWQNPDTGNAYAVTPTQTYQIAGGQYCRLYTQEITVGGEQHETHGTACREADGSWKVQS